MSAMPRCFRSDDDEIDPRHEVPPQVDLEIPDVKDPFASPMKALAFVLFGACLAAVCMCLAMWFIQRPPAPIEVPDRGYRRVTNAMDDYIATHVRTKKLERLANDID